ncbi:MAG: hypothetical protein COA94_02995, partial [Rickettsiales bacterium]
NFSFEVLRKPACSHKSASVEDLVTSMIMIPGSGEYVYDTKIQQKTILTPHGAEIETTDVNSHNYHKIANSVHSLNQLQQICKNTEWVSPVVCWFGDNINARDCLIKPAVEFKDTKVAYSEEWRVGGYNRETAYEITKDAFDRPLYGGSVNDASVVRYLKELKSRNLKTMFYPMFFLDVPQKPWRGHMTTEPEYVRDFFQKEHGYNDFILHYAELARDHVDAFVIGSELIGLTSIRSGDNFPAVDELVALAQKVKQIMGDKVLVTYAADWSEYHHTTGGWFNLDPLWASSGIDFVGIDAYFPVAPAAGSVITKEELEAGWNSGEGYDYYIDQSDDSKHPLAPEYAWKNLRYWWENPHKNPDGALTEWVPRSKPIWFTEFGFPSINQATNQPNVFFDPRCIDGGVPKGSNGNIDFTIQRRAIKAFIEYWKTQEYIGQMFLWTWDARPYPAWPHMRVWRDGNLWEKGHWVNNKFGTSNLGAILLEISLRSQINLDHVDVSTLDDTIEGFVLSNQMTAINAIDMLRASYFFDICGANQEMISFIKRGSARELSVSSSECLKLSDNSFIEEIEIPKEVTLDKVDLYFIDGSKEYSTNYIYVNNETNSYTDKATLRTPLVITEAEAKIMGELLLENASIEDKIISFILNKQDFKLKPTDFVSFKHAGREYSIRVINTEIHGNQMIVTGIVDYRDFYLSVASAKNQLTLEYEHSEDSNLVILDLPFIFNNARAPYLAAYLCNNASAPLYSKLPHDLHGNWSRIASLEPTNALGTLVEFIQPRHVNMFMIDETSKLIVKGRRLEKYALGAQQLAMIGGEVITFRHIEKLQDGLYKISYLTRGGMGTENLMTNHAPGEDFVIINAGMGMNMISVSKKLIGKPVIFRACSIEKSMIYENKAQSPLPPFVTYEQISGHELHIKWVTRSRHYNQWDEPAGAEDSSFTVKLHLNANGDAAEYQSLTWEIIIAISALDLSAGYSVDIIKGGN